MHNRTIRDGCVRVCLCVRAVNPSALDCALIVGTGQRGQNQNVACWVVLWSVHKNVIMFFIKKPRKLPRIYAE